METALRTIRLLALFDVKKTSLLYFKHIISYIMCQGLFYKKLFKMFLRYLLRLALLPG